MKKILILLICMLTLNIGSLYAEKNKFVVVIDPGHGGREPGAVRGEYKEKTINLGVALALGKLIENNCKDVTVVYTRKTDISVDLTDRANKANKAKANLFISIHTNSTEAKKTTATGADTYILGLARSAENLEVAKRENSVILLEDNYTSKYQGFDPKSPESYIIFEFMTNKYMDQSLQLASFIQSEFKNTAKRKDRGVRQAGFLVLRESSMPSVLIELGFINNSTEAKFLVSTGGQNLMARSIFSGFKKYKANFDKMQNTGAVGDNRTAGTPGVDKEKTAVKTVSQRTSAAVSKTGPTPTTKPTISKDDIEYRIQILIAKKELPKKSSVFRGLSPVNFYLDGGIYKYTYGSSTDHAEISRIRKEVKKKFADCFIVKFKNGKRIN